MASHRSPAARANHHAHFRQRIPNPDFENVLPNARRQNNPFDVFTSALFGGNDNPRHKHRTTTLPVPPKPTPPVVIPSPPPPVLSKSPVVEPSVTVVSEPLPPVVTPNPPPPPPAPKGTSTTVHPSVALPSVTHATSSVSPSQGVKSANSAGATTSTTSPSSTGVIVGVIIAVVGVIALVTAAWFIRKKKMAQRAKMRKSWTAGFSLAGDKSWTQEDTSARTNLMSERTPETPGFSKPLPDPNQRASVVGALRTVETIAPPPNTFNNPIGAATYRLPHATVGGASGISARSGQEGDPATVKRGFIPSLPDELSISLGDVVNILVAYDDGWCLACNAFGDRGMVPLECLNCTSSTGHAFGSHVEMERQDTRNEQNRMSRRASSLYVGVMPQDGY